MSAFKDYVTSTAFAMTISRRQIEAISMIHKYGSCWLLLTTFEALQRKGLAERLDHRDERGAYIGLTEAGRAVVPLLRLAGLLIDYPDMPEPEDVPPIEIKVRMKEPKEFQP